MISFVLQRLSVGAILLGLSGCLGGGKFIDGSAQIGTVAPTISAAENQVVVSSQRFQFGFELVQAGQLTAFTSGAVDTQGILLDSTLDPSRSVAEDDNSGDGGNFRIVQDLDPGSYDVLVQARNIHDGPYTLSILFQPRQGQ